MLSFVLITICVATSSAWTHLHRASPWRSPSLKGASQQLFRCRRQATSRRQLLAGAAVRAASGGLNSKSSDASEPDGGDAPGFDDKFDWGKIEPKVATTVIDSAVHVWSDGKAPFPWAEGKEPPEEFQHGVAGPEALLARMERSSVAGALIVQPINHLFDHSFVESVIKAHPASFKGMALANPTLPLKEACAEIERLRSRGFAGVRFNPALWPQGSGGMGNDVGRGLFAKCGELGMPVGVMCMSGFSENADVIEALMTESPDTTCVIDHYGFIACQSRAPTNSMAEEANTEDEWERLLSWGERFPNCVVKASAPFRVSEFEYPYVDVRLRFAELVDSFGADRVFFGTDSPFCLQEFGFKPDGSVPDPAYAALVRVPFEWKLPNLTPEDLNMVLRGTAERLFGKWEA